MTQPIDDTALAEHMSEHLHDHQERVTDCVVCQQVMKHLNTWFLGQTMPVPDPWSMEYDVRVDERGWMVIRHRGCDKRVAEWPHAQGMWPLTYEHLLAEARIHEREEHPK